MERLDQIIVHPKYIEYLERIREWEKERIFCHHDTNHFMDVARIAWILNLEEELKLNKELLYATALLHDIGRFKQYQDGEDHALVSARLAPEILKDCGFTTEEIESIVDAIAHHRDKNISKEKSLRGVIYRGDKLSRDCYFCRARTQCDWKNDKKNLVILY